MKSLIEYLEKANHYLYELSEEQLCKERQKAIAYCEAKHLEEDFQKQVEEMLQTFTLKKEIMSLLTEIEVLKQEIANMED